MLHTDISALHEADMTKWAYNIAQAESIFSNLQLFYICLLALVGWNIQGGPKVGMQLLKVGLRFRE